MPSVAAGPARVPSVRESRNQEWVMMYAAGLSCERIAELCRVSRAAVFAHIQEHATIDPGLRNRHQTRAEDPVARRWNTTYQALKRFVDRTDWWPVSGTDGTEGELALWIAEQRRRHRRGLLSEDRIILLDAAGPWQLSSRALADEQRWWTRLKEAATNRRETGRWPRWRNPDNEQERVLGVWIHGQRQQLTRALLTDDKLAALNENLPGWSERRQPGRPADSTSRANRSGPADGG